MSENKKKFRSPPYPSISLAKAIERAAELHSMAPYSVPMVVASKAWGFSEKSSSTTTVVAALSQYGLLEDQGVKDARKVSLTPLAEKIIMDKRPESQEKISAIREAAMKPSIFRDIWEKYQSPSVDVHVLVYELTVGRKHSGDAPYSASAAEDIARLYNEVMAYAGISSEIIINPDAEARESDDSMHLDPLKVAQESEMVERKREVFTSIPQEISASDEHFEERKALDEGPAVLIWPRNLSQDSVEDMEYWLNGVLRQIKRRIKREHDAE